MHDFQKTIKTHNTPLVVFCWLIVGSEIELKTKKILIQRDRADLSGSIFDTTNVTLLRFFYKLLV